MFLKLKGSRQKYTIKTIDINFVFCEVGKFYTQIAYQIEVS